MNIILPKIKSNIKQEAKVYPYTEFVLYFDGCSKGNPGPSGIGAVIYKDGIEYWCDSKFIGDKRTNNEAEYSALILGLKAAISYKIKNLSVYGDSLLVINQINKTYKVKNPNLYQLYEEVNILKKEFTYIEFNHVYRKDNKRADELSNIALECLEDSSSESTIIDNSIIEDTIEWKADIIIDNYLKKKEQKI